MLKTLFRTAKATPISAEAVRARLKSGDPVYLLDVRTPEAYAEVHIPGSINLPLAGIQQSVGSAVPDKGAKIIVYCRSGGRSEMAAAKLLAMGYTNVSDMGGIFGWRYETESSLQANRNR